MAGLLQTVSFSVVNEAGEVKFAVTDNTGSRRWDLTPDYADMIADLLKKHAAEARAYRHILIPNTSTVVLPQ